MVNGETFLILKLENLFFDGIFADETENKDVVLLPYTMSATHGLVFDGRVPPIIKKDDTIGGSEVETYATCLQTDKKDGNVGIGLELSNGCGAVVGVAIEGDEADAALTEELFHLVKCTNELRED